MVIEGDSHPDRVIEKTNSRLPAGKRSPCRDVAVVRSLLVLRCSREQNALHTLIHQRHLTPSCGGHAPTAERTLDPARIIGRELDPRPGIREQPRWKADIRSSHVNDAGLLSWCFSQSTKETTNVVVAHRIPGVG